MLIDWTKHLKDPEAKAKFEDQIRGARPVLEHLLKIVEDSRGALDRSETNINVYAAPNWDFRQAHKNGNRETLNYFEILLRSTYDR